MITVDVGGADVVHDISLTDYVGVEATFISSLQDAFQKAGLPVTRLGEAKVDQASDCS